MSMEAKAPSILFLAQTSDSSDVLVPGQDKLLPEVSFAAYESFEIITEVKGTGNFEDYEEIGDLFSENDVERPLFLYFGPNRTFYTRIADGTEKWKLSHDIIHNGLQTTAHATVSGVKSLWLGVSCAWVAQYRDDRFQFDLKGQYAGLEDTLQKKQEEEVCIAALALNVTDGSSYACVFEDGTKKYEAGSAGFDGKEFERWCDENFKYPQRVRYY